MVPKAHMTSEEAILTSLPIVVVPNVIPARPHGPSDPLDQLMKSS